MFVDNSIKTNKITYFHLFALVVEKKIKIHKYLFAFLYLFCTNTQPRILRLLNKIITKIVCVNTEVFVVQLIILIILY